MADKVTPILYWYDFILVIYYYNTYRLSLLKMLGTYELNEVTVIETIS